ncbi:MAG TPA: CoA-transferase [Acidimicrobiia bacterium]|nr:CoA-transferase [Acidimicrobiia bacterium]
MSILQSLPDVVAGIPDGSAVGLGGVLLKRKPMAAVAALAAAGRRDLRLFTFLGSVDVEALVAAGAVAEVHGGYVGFEQLGFAPATKAAFEDGSVVFHEYSEFLFVAGLRASLAGLPFMPAKGGAGSDLVGELGIVEIADPYTGTPVLAVPALRPDVTFIHAEASDAAGNVAGPSSPDFLWDFDAAIARAAGRVVVTVEEIVDSVAGRAMLFAHEVDAVVLAPGGAAPSAMPGRHPADLTRLRGYLADPASGPGPLLGQPS